MAKGIKDPPSYQLPSPESKKLRKPKGFRNIEIYVRKRNPLHFGFDHVFFGEIVTKNEVVMRPYYYDGYNWENPFCTHCNTGLCGLPVDATERQIFLSQRPEKVKLLERIG